MRRRCGERQGREAEICWRLPDKNCDRVFVLRTRHAHINGLRAGRLQLGLGLLDIDFRSNPSLKTTLIQFQRLLVLLHRRVQELFLGIQAAGLKVVNSKISVHAQIDRRQVRSTCLCLFSIRLHVFSDLPQTSAWYEKSNGSTKSLYVVPRGPHCRRTVGGGIASRAADGPAVTVG